MVDKLLVVAVTFVITSLLTIVVYESELMNTCGEHSNKTVFNKFEGVFSDKEMLCIIRK